MNRLEQLFFKLYPKNSVNKKRLLRFINKLPPKVTKTTADNKRMIIYALYVDQFALNFPGLIKHLDHIINLGCNVLWLLPILKSPGLDQGFDISDYYHVRQELGGNQAFFNLLKLAKARNLKIIFDISINHSSIKHPWFKNKPDFYIWSKNRHLYTDGNRVIFPHDPADPTLDQEDPRQKWVWHQPKRQYYYRTFYQHQPDLNYHNPELLLAMSQVLAFWAKKGVAGFRADAAPFLWKENKKINESLPQTHIILQFFQAVIALVNQEAFLLAEACQKPRQLMAYLNPHECSLAYNFPRMTALWQAILTQNCQALITDIQATPKPPKGCNWLMFLRLHDELCLEMLPDKERQLLYQRLIPNGLDFRNGYGVAGRLASFLNNDPKKILFAWALLLVQPGLPLIFQGDDIGQTNNYNYYQKMKQLTNQNDTRFVNRGPMVWNKNKQKVYTGLRRLIKLSCQYHFDKAELQLIKEQKPHLFSCLRQFNDQQILCQYNLKNFSFTWSPLNKPPARVRS